MMNAFLFISWVVVHSLSARSGCKKFIAKIAGDDYERPFYSITASITLFIILFLWRPLRGTLWQTGGILDWITTILYIGCLVGAVYASSLIDKGEFWGIKRLIRRLKNITAEPSLTLSIKGPYAYCRHPIYLFVVLSFWVGPIMSYSRFEFAVIGTLYFVIGVFLEELNLRQELGDVYRLYQKNVPMWIPRIKPWRYNEK